MREKIALYGGGESGLLPIAGLNFDGAESAVDLFLNCTKNTELTCGAFDRTVSFAHT